MEKPAIGPHDRRLMIEPEIVSRLYNWHGGQWSGVYSLASCAHENLVSIAMIERAIGELESDLARVRREKRTAENRRDRADLASLIGDLDCVRAFPAEHDYACSGAWDGEAFETDGLHESEECDYCGAQS